MKRVLLMCFLHFTMILLFALLLITQVASFGSQCGGLDHRLFSAENRVLKNYTYQRKTVPNHVMCGRDCSMDKNCKSFNFYTCNKLCELNNASRAEHPDNFVEDQQGVYFDDDKTTLFYTSTEPTTAYPSTEPTTAYPSTEPTTAYPSTEPTTPYPSTEPTTAYPSTEPTSAYPSTEPTTAYPSTEPTTAYPSTEPTTAYPSTEPTTAYPSTEPTTAYPSTEPLTHYKSCKRLLDAGYHTSQVYTIYPDGFNGGLHVYCDMDTDGGGWIVFQRRLDGSVAFNRDWTEYKSGFGDLAGEHWLGNDNLAKLTSTGNWYLHVDLEDWNEQRAYAKYDGVSISGEDYTLNIGSYLSGRSTADDTLNDNKGNPFTARDRDNDQSTGNCAQTTNGAWWFKDCTVKSNLNGQYGQFLQWQTRHKVGIMERRIYQNMQHENTWLRLLVEYKHFLFLWRSHRRHN